MPKVFVVNRPIRNKFGWTPDLSDASRYGSIEVVFEPDDNPQFVPSPMIMKARKIMRDPLQRTTFFGYDERPK